MEFIRSFESSIVNHFTPMQVNLITQILTKTLADYEISTRCTSVAIQDDFNEKIIKQYAACLLVDGKSKNTISQYVRTIRHFSGVIGKHFTDISQYDIRFYLAKEMERGVSDRTRDNTRSKLSALFSWMEAEEILERNPMKAIKPIKYKDEIRKSFSDVEIDALRGACQTNKERALVEILLSTGVRVSELAAMNVQDIDQNTLSVHVINGKGAKERMTYTTAVSMKHVASYLKLRKENGDALFYNKNHERLNSGGIRFILNTVAARASVDNVHPHRFRRTFATNLSRRGMNIQEIQRLMGHSDINTTMKYISLDDNKVSSSYKQHIN